MAIIGETDELRTIIKALLASRMNSTLAELREDYDYLIGDNRLPWSFNDLRKLVESIEGVKSITNDYGLEMWTVQSEKSRHIQQMAKRQKPRRSKRTRTLLEASDAKQSNNVTDVNGNQMRNLVPRKVMRREPGASMKNKQIRTDAVRKLQPVLDECAKAAPSASLPSRTSSGISSMSSNSQQTGTEIHKHDRERNKPETNRNINRRKPEGAVGRPKKREGYYYNYQLMGDDFFLSIAKIELGSRWEKDAKNVLNIGVCTSGMTIKEAARKVRSPAFIDSRVIVYLGSVDILHGRHAQDIVYDYLDLMSAFHERGIRPIVCTLAPLANINHDDSRLEAFNVLNKFLLEKKNWDVLDIRSCFVHETTGKTIFEIYLPSTTKVSGSSRPHVLWNKLGRQRVIRKIKSHIAGKF